MTSSSSEWNATRIAQSEELLGQAVCRRMGIYALPAGFVLTVIVPIYNEVGTIDDLVARLLATGLPLQIILVDDGSVDGTAEKLEALAKSSAIRVICHPANRGKGAAIRSGLESAQGDVIVIQDADREYDPEDFRYLLQPILEDRADVVYGTRYGHSDHQVSPLWHAWVNGWLTCLTNLVLGIRLSDVETCYKMARREAWLAIRDDLREQRFGIEIELTARWARHGFRFYERPIRYQHRWYAEGKKIGWKDGVAALFCIARYGLLRR
jgi:glycosyltransferase involved in cell wall biosynthesis